MQGHPFSQKLYLLIWSLAWIMTAVSVEKQLVIPDLLPPLSLPLRLGRICQAPQKCLLGCELSFPPLKGLTPGPLSPAHFPLLNLHPVVPPKSKSWQGNLFFLVWPHRPFGRFVISPGKGFGTFFFIPVSRYREYSHVMSVPLPLLSVFEIHLGFCEHYLIWLLNPFKSPWWLSPLWSLVGDLISWMKILFSPFPP